MGLIPSLGDFRCRGQSQKKKKEKKKNETSCVGVPALLLTSCGALGKLLNLSVPQSLPTGMLGKENEMVCIKPLGWC